MHTERKLLWLEYCLLLANFALMLLQAFVGPDSGNTYISNSNVVIYYRHQEEITSSALIKPAYQIATQGGQNAMMRVCGSRNCEIVTHLPDRTPIHVMESVHGESIEGSDVWFQIDHNGSIGFVFGKLVREIDSLT